MACRSSLDWLGMTSLSLRLFGVEDLSLSNGSVPAQARGLAPALLNISANPRTILKRFSGNFDGLREFFSRFQLFEESREQRDDEF